MITSGGESGHRGAVQHAIDGALRGIGPVASGVWADVGQLADLDEACSSMNDALQNAHLVSGALINKGHCLFYLGLGSLIIFVNAH